MARRKHGGTHTHTHPHSQPHESTHQAQHTFLHKLFHCIFRRKRVDRHPRIRRRNFGHNRKGICGPLLKLLGQKNRNPQHLRDKTKAEQVRDNDRQDATLSMPCHVCTHAHVACNRSHCFARQCTILCRMASNEKVFSYCCKRFDALRHKSSLAYTISARRKHRRARSTFCSRTEVRWRSDDPQTETQTIKQLKMNRQREQGKDVTRLH